MTLSAEQRAVVNEASRIKREARKAAASARPKSPKATRGREVDTGFLAYIRRQPCEARHKGGCSGPIEAAHIRYSDAAAGSINPGMQRRNHDRHCNPLCRHHHQSDQHKRSERAFWADLGKDAYATAAGHYAAYQSDGLTKRAQREAAYHSGNAVEGEG